MQPKISETQKVSTFFSLFHIYAIQIGVGVLYYERLVAKAAGYDGWVGVLLAGASTLVVMWLIFRIMDRGQGDLIVIHRQLFGKWIGNGLSLLFAVYLLSLGLTILRSYVELIQVWLFPTASYWVFGFLVIFVAYFFISGGLRGVTAVSFLSVIYGTPLFFALYYPLAYAHYDNLLPLFNHSFGEYFAATKVMALNYMGFEILFLTYPFYKKQKEAQKWAYFGALMTIFIYFILTVIAFVFYSFPHLMHIIWGTMTLWMTVNLPFLERFEYVGITIWFFIIMPNLCLVIWGASRVGKVLFKWRQRILVVFLLVATLIVGAFFSNHHQIVLLNHFESNLGFYFLYGYIPLLFIYQTIVLKVRKRHAKSK